MIKKVSNQSLFKGAFNRRGQSGKMVLKRMIKGERMERVDKGRHIYGWRGGWGIVIEGIVTWEGSVAL